MPEASALELTGLGMGRREQRGACCEANSWEQRLRSPPDRAPSAPLFLLFLPSFLVWEQEEGIQEKDRTRQLAELAIAPKVRCLHSASARSWGQGGSHFSPALRLSLSLSPSLLQPAWFLSTDVPAGRKPGTALLSRSLTSSLFSPLAEISAARFF